MYYIIHVSTERTLWYLLREQGLTIQSIALYCMVRPCSPNRYHRVIKKKGGGSENGGLTIQWTVWSGPALLIDTIEYERITNL